MIRGHCFTNLDDWKRYAWPKVFAVVPRIGERVQAEEGGWNLKVVGVTHYVEKVRSEYGKFNDGGGRYDLEPRIKVELHK